MSAVGVALEASLWVSSVAFLCVFVFALLYRDGAVWNVFRWKTGAGFTGTLFAAVAVHNMDFSRYRFATVAGCCLIGVVISRLVQAVANLMMGLHLKRLIGKKKKGRKRA